LRESLEEWRLDFQGLERECERRREAATDWLELKMSQMCMATEDRELWRGSLLRALGSAPGQPQEER
jgi:hypothetical protein